MNIRGTDSTALAAVTDLFVAPTPPRDGGAGGFQQALQPPRPFEAAPNSATRQDSNTPPRKEPATPADEASSSKREVCRSEEPAAESPAAENAVEQSSVTDEVPTEAVAKAPVDEERIEDQDVAAESLVAAAIVIAEQTLPEQQPVAVTSDESIAQQSGAENVTDAEEAQAAANVQPTIDAAPLATLPTEQPVGEITVATPEVAVVADDVASELPPDAVAADSSQPPAGIGVLPSAIAPPAVNNATRNVSARPAPKATAAVGDKIQPAKNVTQATDSAIALETAPVLSTDSIAAGQMTNPDDDFARTTNKSDPFAFAADKSVAPTLQQPVDILNPLDVKVEAPAAAATEAPVVAELHSTQHPTHDPTKLTTTQPPAVSAIAGRLPAEALVRGVRQEQPPPPLHVDAARFLQRVTKAFESARERGGEIRLRLSPPELGALRVEVNMSEQGLAARVEVETNDARTILLENLPALRERLAEQGLKLERFDVDLSRRDAEQQGGNFPEQSRERQSQPEARTMRNTIPRPNTATNTPAEITPTTGWQDRQLNVIV